MSRFVEYSSDEDESVFEGSLGESFASNKHPRIDELYDGTSDSVSVLDTKQQVVDQDVPPVAWSEQRKALFATRMGIRKAMQHNQQLNYTDRHWAFTWNNYTDADYQWLVDNVRYIHSFRYIVFAKEVASTGTPHIQGHISFLEKKSIRKMKSKDGFNSTKINFSLACDVESSIEYCKKTGQFVEIGDRPISLEAQNVGARASKEAKWSEYMQHAKEGNLDKIPAQAYISHKRAFDEIKREHFKPVLPPSRIVTLYPWQAELVDYVNQPVHHRKIRWYVDEVGGKGKSAMALYLIHNCNAHLMRSAKHADMCHMIPEKGARVFVFDFARTVLDHVPYKVIEECKDGMVCSSKYDSHMKYFEPPHVIVFANFEPQQNALSADRWDLITL